MGRPRRPCRVCPKWHANYCPIKAQFMVPAHPACDYGIRLMNNAALRRMDAREARLQDETQNQMLNHKRRIKT